MLFISFNSSPTETRPPGFTFCSQSASLPRYITAAFQHKYIWIQISNVTRSLPGDSAPLPLLCLFSLTCEQKHGFKDPIYPYLLGSSRHFEIFPSVSSTMPLSITQSTRPQGVLGLLFAFFMTELALFITPVPLLSPREESMS